MTSIADFLPAGPAAPGFKNSPQAGAVHQEKFLHMLEKLEAGVTIHTREGDVVTLSAGSSAAFASSEYNSQGVIQAENGTSRAGYHQRTVSLHTSESFSFGVQGDLNEQELADIDAIIQGIDGIIGQMATGNMDAAFSLAKDMGGFDSISMYAADISLEQRVTYQQNTLSGASYGKPARAGSAHRAAPASVNSPASFTDKMARFLEKQEDMLVGKSAPGLDALFRHHRENLPEKQQQHPEGALSLALESARKQMDQLIKEMMKDSFGRRLDNTA